MNKDEKYLPIGTVVRLKNGKKNIMITGFCVNAKDDNKLYDYCACLHPEGIISSDSNLLFDHNQIDEILYLGYINDEESEFNKRLIGLVNETLDRKSSFIAENNSSFSNNDLWS